MKLRQFRFNRNIVECKLYSRAAELSVAVCFNRNIVECKLFFTSFLTLLHSVLIETLWNVNLLSLLIPWKLLLF